MNLRSKVLRFLLFAFQSFCVEHYLPEMVGRKFDGLNNKRTGLENILPSTKSFPESFWNWNRQEHSRLVCSSPGYYCDQSWKKMLSRIIKSFFVFISRGGKQRRKNLFDFISLLRESIQPFDIVYFVAKWCLLKLRFLNPVFQFKDFPHISVFFQLTVLQILSGDSHCGPRKICGGRMREEYFPYFSAFQLSSLAGHLVFLTFSTCSAPKQQALSYQYALCTALQREQ